MLKKGGKSGQLLFINREKKWKILSKKENTKKEKVINKDINNVNKIKRCCSHSVEKMKKV